MGQNELHFSIASLETYKGDSIFDTWQCFTLFFPHFQFSITPAVYPSVTSSPPTMKFLSLAYCLSFHFSLLFLCPSFFVIQHHKKIKIKLAIAGLSIMNGVREKEIEIFFSNEKREIIGQDSNKFITLQNLSVFLKLWLTLKLTSKENLHLDRKRSML